jgi:endonuclease/exonuclease/phosphatase family metal-dependent hydrolase
MGWSLLNRALSPWRAICLRKLETGPVPAPTFAGRLRLGTYNIAHGRGMPPDRRLRVGKEGLLTRLNEIARMLRDANLDLVVLNEVDFDSLRSHSINQAEFLARAAGFPFWVEQLNVDMALPWVRMRYGNALLSRYPILTARRLPLVGHSTWESALIGRKQGLFGSIQLDEAHIIGIMGVHLEHRREDRRLMGVKIMDEVRRASSLPLILAGDFNSTPRNYPRATPDPQGQTALSWLLGQGAYQTWPTGPPRREDLTFSSLEPRMVIDWILIPRDWKIMAKEVGGGQLSDHLAVVMEVEVRDEIEAF